MKKSIWDLARRVSIKLKRVIHIDYSKDDLDFIYTNDIVGSGHFSGIRVEAGQVQFNLAGGQELSARLFPHSDCAVLRQVFINQEYKPVVDVFSANRLDTRHMRIIDAGANVGYTSAYFLSCFPDSQVVCIEPDEQNAAMLKLNLRSFFKNGQVTLYQNALMSEDERSISIDRDFRDGKDHSISVSESAVDSELKSVTVNRIMKDMAWSSVDILKIDIEGAERFVFKHGAEMDYLSNVKVIAIEIHDEFGIREQIYERLRDFHFVLFEAGETTFGLNTLESIS